MMRSGWKVALLCLAIFVAGFPATAVVAQDKATDSRPARLFFLRHGTVVGIAVWPEIKIDGKSIGSLSPGSYLVVQRPAGRHTIAVSHWGDFGRFEVDVQVAAGASYYYELGMTLRGGGGVLLPSLAGEVGTPMRGRVDSGAYRLNVLSAKTGAASVAKLKR
jgi:hypothetical protein